MAPSQKGKEIRMGENWVDESWGFWQNERKGRYFRSRDMFFHVIFFHFSCGLQLRYKYEYSFLLCTYILYQGSGINALYETCGCCVGFVCEPVSHSSFFENCFLLQLTVQSGDVSND